MSTISVKKVFSLSFVYSVYFWLFNLLVVMSKAHFLLQNLHLKHTNIMSKVKFNYPLKEKRTMWKSICMECSNKMWTDKVDWTGFIKYKNKYNKNRIICFYISFLILPFMCQINTWFTSFQNIIYLSYCISCHIQFTYTSSMKKFFKL